MQIKRNLFVPSKIKYVRGHKPDVDCILCAVIAGDPRVVSLEIFRTDLFCICANLYPYSPGHLLIFSNRHMEDCRSYTAREAREIFFLEKLSLDVLDEVYKPQGYNIGYNIGDWSGNSIRHLHLHVVPRYRNELGFVDIITEARIIVDDPRKNLPRLRRLFKRG
jgi:ATP adenylyltransferase